MDPIHWVSGLTSASLKQILHSVDSILSQCTRCPCIFKLHVVIRGAILDAPISKMHVASYFTFSLKTKVYPHDKWSSVQFLFLFLFFCLFFQFQTRGWTDVPLNRETATTTGAMLTKDNKGDDRPKPPPPQFNKLSQVWWILFLGFITSKIFKDCWLVVLSSSTLINHFNHQFAVLYHVSNYTK